MPVFYKKTAASLLTQSAIQRFLSFLSGFSVNARLLAGEGRLLQSVEKNSEKNRRFFRNSFRLGVCSQEAGVIRSLRDRAGEYFSVIVIKLLRSSLSHESLKDFNNVTESERPKQPRKGLITPASRLPTPNYLCITWTTANSKTVLRGRSKP